jgi:Fe-S oxidoreductase
MNQYVFAPGCALYLYDSALARNMHDFLSVEYGQMEMMLTCCRHVPKLAAGTTVINVCPGCDRRYRENYAQPATVSLWELLAANSRFPFPDYGEQEMTILDACPTRNQDRVHNAVRALAARMNITVVEPKKTRRSGTCCGDTFYGMMPTVEVINRMKQKAAEMPRNDIIVYCVSCSKSMFVGSKKPRYLVDLLFGKETTAGVIEPDAWHGQLDDFIASHRENA